MSRRKLVLVAIAAVVAICGGVYVYRNTGPVASSEADTRPQPHLAEQTSPSATPDLEKQMLEARDAFVKTGDRTKARTFLAAMEKQLDVGKGGSLLNTVRREYPNFGLNRAGMDSIMARLANNPSPYHKLRYVGWQNLVKLRTTPFEFSANTLDGKPFNLVNLRGKIVLIDHWSTNCSMCVDAMPRIRELYRKYKDRGFEVVSAVYDNDEKRSLDRKRVMRIERDLGLTWTTVAAGQYRAISDAYGFENTVPQYMLLARDGTLYAETAEVDYGRNLEPLLQELLARDESRRETAARSGHTPPRA